MPDKNDRVLDPHGIIAGFRRLIWPLVFALAIVLVALGALIATQRSTQ